MFNVQQTITDLEATIAHLRGVGWVQGKNFNSKGDCCCWGAMIYAVSGRHIASAEESLDRTADMGRAFKRVMGEDVVTYNDTDGRTKEQVIAALEDTLAKLKADPSVLTARKDDHNA